MAYPQTHTGKLVVLIGQDERLVQTRRWVLEKAGFRVQTPYGLAELFAMEVDQPVSLFLLCDSLSPEARQDALAVMHSRWPEARGLVLTSSSSCSEFDLPEEVFPAMEGPSKLVATIRKLIVNEPATVA